ncbi:dihydrofolate reductase family protein [Nakamurella leprariae]|uniref:Dihydrofolate reductase n=1 Tax=Nakamurella leprariae TaxID=2803911 RepID=A0A939C1X4_9ACTN|nr:dihydrofolate reductase family protein [Nakamurella leprariae]MBM9467619.1 dihydrofolate reductase [Nakamurella leprariae]
MDEQDRGGEVTCSVAVSLDGYVAGPDQRLDQPLGRWAEQLLHRWMFDEPEQHRAELAAITDAGAFVMGRNMFGPVRGGWDSWAGPDPWRGWWGEAPPYHAPVFVLTHHEREPLTMAGGTTFVFVTEGPEVALTRAREAAGARNVAIAGGAATINQYLRALAIDELRLHVAPVTLGAGERLFDGVGRLDLRLVEVRGTDRVTHLRYRVGTGPVAVDGA